MINISLTILFVIGVLLQICFTLLLIEDWTDDGAAIGAGVVAIVIGLCITHGEYYNPIYAWTLSHLEGDGWAGNVVSFVIAAASEFFFATLPMIGTTVLYAIFHWPRKDTPQLLGSKRPQGFINSFLRSLRVR